MNWKNFEESKKELPEIVVQKLIEGFSEATKDLAQMYVYETSDKERLSLSDKLKTRFQFKVVLASKYLPDYEYRVLKFGYGVSLYPVKVAIPAQFLDELLQTKELWSAGTWSDEFGSFSDEKEFQWIVAAVFETNSFKEIVSGLMKIARKNSENS